MASTESPRTGHGARAGRATRTEGPRTGHGARARLRGAWEAVRTSLAVRCLAVVVAYALAVMALFSGIGAVGEAMLDNAFPSMETVLEREAELARDDFAALQSPAFENCLVTVFDGRGARLYASNEKAARKVRSTDLPLINGYEENAFYEVFRERADDGSTRYRIMLCTYDEQSDYSKVVESWCVLDEGLQIVEGDLFSGRTALTQREFDFITGIYDAQMTVERLDYRTENGASRTLVLVAPMVSDTRYQQVLNDVSGISLLGAPIVVALTAVAAWALVRVARGAARPLDRAIDAYRRGDEEAAAGERVPTELMRTYGNFTDLMDELAASRRERQRIVADVSHDLKTPLTVIRGYAQAFAEGRVPPEKERAYLRAIAERSIAATELIDTLVSYAKMEHPEYEPALVRADVSELVRAVARRAEPSVEQAGCSLEVDAAPGALAEVDRELFERVLLNLVDNAWSHNAAGTRIRVSCAPAGEGGAVQVRVADTGAGFAPEIAAHAFEPFVTSNAARSSDGGTGLGLSIARRAVELMGGSIRLEEPCAPWGAVVTVELPAAGPGDAGEPRRPR
ncbi:sensor histidine kinase [Candidatus Collinsella stercoripullorum]|uniref:sensor histidine kinase n=1 Tax=Candidatus Collinsella stercoripullorum TaxID=2838522 RepID=UPI0022E0F16A|nr:HAMP domain-containing sensor histidine kinase [Candidatus Collinsella stercoripullorum]